MTRMEQLDIPVQVVARQHRTGFFENARWSDPDPRRDGPETKPGQLGPQLVPLVPETTDAKINGALAAAEDAMKTAADLTGQGVILLVEDEEGLRALNARGLTSRGYTVIEAGNGVEAMEMLEREGGKVDLVVSDVVMPEMDGPTLLKELRKKNPETKIIFVSGYAEDAFQKSLPNPDDYNFLAKPFTLKQLVAKVKETMATV